jgi:hypothetical protein
VRRLSLILIIIATSFLSCKDEAVIHAQTNGAKFATTDVPYFYSRFNFLLDTTGRLYYHTKDSILNCCDTGEDRKFPDYIGLVPSDLHEASDSFFFIVVDSVRHQEVQKRNSLQIALVRDSITHPRLLKLIDQLKVSGTDNFAIRIATEEERVVLSHKVQAKPYDFYQVDWKERFSNVLFPPPPVDK